MSCKKLILGELISVVIYNFQNGRVHIEIVMD